MPKKILVVDDEKPISDIIKFNLAKEGFDVDTAYDGEEAVKKVEEYNPDLMILDLMLPKKDGLEVAREVRQTHDMPIIMVTAKDTEIDKVLGLEMGADDYVTKPFSNRELVARVKAVLRRYHAAPMTPVPTVIPSTNHQGNYVEYPNLIVNQTNYSVTYNGRSVEMPPKELELLYFLASSPNQVFTREQLLDHIWGYEYIGDTRTVDVHIKRLREKIKDNQYWALTTVWGIGYKFEVKH